MKRTHKKLGVFAAVVVACAAIAAFVGTNISGAHIIDLRHSLRLLLQPDNVNAYISRGNAMGELGRYQDAIADYDQALQHKPGNALAYHNRALAKFNSGLSQDAFPNYDQALLEQPDLSDGYQDSLTSHLRRTKFEQ